MATSKRNGTSYGVSEIKRKTGKIRYEARINVAGHKDLSKTFDTKAEAKAWRTKTLALIHTGSPLPKKNKVLVGDAIDAYVQHLTSINKLSSNRKTEYMKVKNDLGDRPIEQLTTLEIEQWIAMLQQVPRGHYKDGREKPPYAEASARRFFYCLKPSLEWHSRNDGYTLPPYLLDLSKAAKPDAWAGHRERRLRDDEEEKLYAGGLTRKGCYNRQDWEAMIGFALETAMRQQEIFYAKFDDIEKSDDLLRIPKGNSKTKTGRKVPLSNKVKAVIELQRKTSPEGNKRIFHQFPSATAIGTAFTTLVERVGIEDLHFHDLRHEAISRLCVSHEMTLPQIMKVTGHKSFKTFDGYLQLYEMHERKALQKTSAKASSEAERLRQEVADEVGHEPAEADAQG